LTLYWIIVDPLHVSQTQLSIKVRLKGCTIGAVNVDTANFAA
jgi:hypothetical protein